MSENGNRVLSVSEVAKMLRRPVRTVRRWCETGLLPAMRAGERGKFMIKEKDLESLNYKPKNEKEH